MDEILYLMHHGVKGQKWGVRRYQNPDGSLTDAGRKRYYAITDKKPDRNKMISEGATSGAIAGGVSAGVVGGVIGSVAGAGAGYATYRLKNRQYKRASETLKKDNDRRQAEYENSEEYKQWQAKLKKQGAKLNSGGAESFANYENTQSIRSFAEVEAHKSDFAKKHGLSTPKKYHEYMKKALKNFNENDPDQVVYQHMDEAFAMLDKGYITKSTFNKLYDGQLAIDAYDFSNWGSQDLLEQWHDLKS